MRDLAASPRLTGTDGAARARERCVNELRGMGFDVVERPFEYSAFPGRFGVPLFGVAGAAIMLAVLAAAVIGASDAFVWYVRAAIVTLFAAIPWMSKRGVPGLPLMRASGVNIEATRAGATPRVWLCAHVDSKSQLVPTLIRSTGLVLESAGLLMLLGMTFTALMPSSFAAQVVIAALTTTLTLAGSIPVVLCMVGNRSNGALDNASGVATVVAAARLLGDQRDVGVLLTDAEELGLAGARAWSRGRQKSVVINVDGVDDAGEIRHLRFPGILTDANAFQDAGLESFTVSRGGMLSLLRVHSRRDNLERLRGDGIQPTARFVVDRARRLLGGLS